MQQDCAVALCNMLSKEDCALMIAYDGGLSAAADLAVSEDETCRSYVVHAIFNLSCCKDIFPRLVEAGVIRYVGHFVALVASRDSPKDSSSELLWR